MNNRANDLLILGMGIIVLAINIGLGAMMVSFIKDCGSERSYLDDPIIVSITGILGMSGAVMVIDGIFYWVLGHAKVF